MASWISCRKEVTTTIADPDAFEEDLRYDSWSMRTLRAFDRLEADFPMSGVWSVF
jgi:hypothetical protein